MNAHWSPLDLALPHGTDEDLNQFLLSIQVSVDSIPSSHTEQPNLIAVIRQHFSINLVFHGTTCSTLSYEPWNCWWSDVVYESDTMFVVKYAIVPRHSSGVQILTIKDSSVKREYETELVWDIKSNIDIHSDVRIAGWAFNVTQPNHSLSLISTENNKISAIIETGLERSDVVEAFSTAEENLRPGFDITLPRKNITVVCRNITIAGTNIRLEGKSQYAFYSQDGIKNISTSARETLMLVSHGNEVVNSLISRMQYLIGEEFTSRFLRSTNFSQTLKVQRPNFERGLSVVIPVYDGYEQTVRCIQSVLKSLTELKLEIIIGFDAGPNEEIWKYIDSINDQRVVKICHAENLGFVGNVNSLVMMKSFHDFILLNSDTVVADYVFDRLRSCLDDDRSIASVTPVSNNATIFTLGGAPRPDLKHLNEVNAAIAGNSGTVRIPVGHGFCMLINGTVYEMVGLFDELEWGKGYGEEVDWCLKVNRDLGAHHVCRTDVYVYHEGSVSFGNDQRIQREAASSSRIEELHPGYEGMISSYSRAGYLNRELIKLDIAAGKKVHNQGTKSIAFISHSFGGGVDKAISDEIARQGVAVNKYLIRLEPCVGGRYWRVELPNGACRYFKSDEQIQLLTWLRALGVVELSLEHMGYATFDEVHGLISNFENRVVAKLHDFAFVCPRVNLIASDGRYCGVQDSVTCDLCLDKVGAYEAFDANMRTVTDVADYRAKARRILAAADEIVAPSGSTRDLYKTIYSDANIQVKVHHREPKFVYRHAGGRSNDKVVGVIGSISHWKGFNNYQFFADYLRKLDPEIKLVIFGHTADDAEFSKRKNVVVTGAYASFEELKKLVDYYKPAASLFLNEGPETFCYALSEAIKLGLFPFYYNIGAVGERLRKRKLGKEYPAAAPIGEIARDVVEWLARARVT